MKVSSFTPLFDDVFSNSPQEVAKVRTTGHSDGPMSSSAGHLKNSNDSVYRLGVSSQSMNEIYFRSRTRMSSGPDVLLGVSFPPSSKRRNPRVRISMLELSAIIVKRSKQNSSAYARMCLMCWTSHLSQRPSQANQKSFIIKCTSFVLNI